MFANVCPNLPDVRSYPALPYYIQLFRNQIFKTAIACKRKSPPRGIKEVLDRVKKNNMALFYNDKIIKSKQNND